MYRIIERSDVINEIILEYQNGERETLSEKDSFDAERYGNKFEYFIFEVDESMKTFIKGCNGTLEKNFISEYSNNSGEILYKEIDALENIIVQDIVFRQMDVDLLKDALDDLVVRFFELPYNVAAEGFARKDSLWRGGLREIINALGYSVINNISKEEIDKFFNDLLSDGQLLTIEKLIRDGIFPSNDVINRFMACVIDSGDYVRAEELMKKGVRITDPNVQVGFFELKKYRNNIISKALSILNDVNVKFKKHLSNAKKIEIESVELEARDDASLFVGNESFNLNIYQDENREDFMSISIEYSPNSGNIKNASLQYDAGESLVLFKNIDITEDLICLKNLNFEPKPKKNHREAEQGNF